jgi:hypothetical protein
MSLFLRVALWWPLHCFLFQVLLIVAYLALAQLLYGHQPGSLFFFHLYPAESGRDGAANFYLATFGFHVALRLLEVEEYAVKWREQGFDLRYRAGTRAREMDWSWMNLLGNWAVSYGVAALHVPWSVGWILGIHLYLMMGSSKDSTLGFPFLLLLGATIFVPKLLHAFMHERFYPHNIERIHRNRDQL